MRGAGAGFVAAVLALAGCKSADPKPADGRTPPGSPAGRTKGQGPAWLDESMAKLPGAGTGVPKADSWAHPKDPNFNVANEVKGVFAGRVTDPAGQGAKNVFIQIDPADGPPVKPGAEIGIWTDANGYFLTKGLKPGQTYTLTARAQVDGKPLSGVVQARTPQANLAIALRDDFGLPPAATPTPVAGGAPGFPPAAGDRIPPMGVAPAPPRPTDGAWAPGTGAATAPVPATFGSPAFPPAPTPALPPPADPRAIPSRPENFADGPQPWKPPAVSIPGSSGPPVPPLPVPPPTSAPARPVSRAVVRPGANFVLADTLDRPWDFATSRSGSLVLLDFMTTTCVPCKRAIPVLMDVQSRYAADGLQLVGVVCDEVPQAERTGLADKYQREHNLNYALYVEPGPRPGPVRDRFGVEGYPTAVLLDGDGGVVWKGHPGDREALEAAVRRQLGK